jgi:FixJ family two-component response regulator
MRGCDIYLGNTGVAQAETILIAVGDGVLADSLRFSLELEGFETRFCDEYSLLPAMSAPCVRGGCLVLDQEVFARLVEGEDAGLFADRGMPVILMVSHTTKRVLASAEAAGVTEVVEKPLLGGVLSDAIRQVIGEARHSARPLGPR